MITLKVFLGAFLEQVTAARALGDAASARIAQRYLEHDYLKGFPVPKMHIKDIELEMHFAVASNLEGGSIYQNSEVRANISHKIRQLVATLPAQPEFKGYFDQNPQQKTTWNNKLDELDQRVNTALMTLSNAKDPDRGTAVRSLSLIIENYIHETAMTQSQNKWVAMVTHLFQSRKDDGQDRTIASYVSDHVGDIIKSVDTLDQESESIADNFDMKVLVEASELAKVDNSRLQKMKVTFSTADRKWVSTQQNGEKSYLLDRK